MEVAREVKGPRPESRPQPTRPGQLDTARSAGRKRKRGPWNSRPSFKFQTEQGASCTPRYLPRSELAPRKRVQRPVGESEQVV